MKKYYAVIAYKIFFVLCMYGCNICANRIQHVSIELENKEHHHHLTFSTNEVNSGVSKCPVCAAAIKKESLFASFFSMQSLVSYLDTLSIDMSASDATLDLDTLECQLLRIMDFVLQNTFPNIVTLRLPNDVAAATSTTTLYSNLQDLYVSGDRSYCLADQEAWDMSIILTYNVTQSQRWFFSLQLQNGCGANCEVWLIVFGCTSGSPFFILYFVIVLLDDIVSLVVPGFRTVFIDIPIAIAGSAHQFIRSLMGLAGTIAAGAANAVTKARQRGRLWTCILWHCRSHL
jgi:hypothetical protein